jgi:3-oxoacyl-[acyl-carrier-protein] synthase-3
LPESIRRAAILGVGTYSPARVVTNQDLEKLVDTNDEWIVQRTGIRERRRAADDELTSDLCVNAAITALEKADTRPEDLDLIIVGTITPDMPMPSTAAFVQAKLGAAKATAFDLSAACAGFMYCLSVADSFVRSRGAERVLIIGAEILTRFTNWTDRNTCVLFGDGAGAAVLGPSPDGERGILSVHTGTDGTQTDILTIPAGGSRTPHTPETLEQQGHKIYMDGRSVFKHAVRRLAEYAMLALDSNGLTADDIDKVIAHQANLRILQSVAKRCGLSMDDFHLNIERYGNTSSASVPIVLEEAIDRGVVAQGDTLLLLAMGAGLAYGSAVVRL